MKEKLLIAVLVVVVGCSVGFDAYAGSYREKHWVSANGRHEHHHIHGHHSATCSGVAVVQESNCSGSVIRESATCAGSVRTQTRIQTRVIRLKPVRTVVVCPTGTCP